MSNVLTLPHKEHVQAPQVGQDARATRKRRRVQRFFIALLVVITAIILAVVLYLKVFVVQSISCHFGQDTCPEAVIAELNRLQGRSIFSSFSPTQTKLAAALHQASDVEIQRKLPSTLSVEITPSGILGALTVDLSTGYMVINTNGRVADIAKEKPPGMIVMRIDRRYALSEEIEPEMKQVLELFVTQYTLLPFTELHYQDRDMIEIRLENGKTAIVRAKDLSDQLNTLQLLLNEATMIQNASVIDLRFSHPVLR